VKNKPGNVAAADAVQVPFIEKNILSVAKGGGITFAGKMFLSVIRLVTAVLLARLLGAEQYGMYTLAISVATIAASLAVFGLDTALIRYIAVQTTKDDEVGVWGTLQVGVGTALILSVLTGTGLYAMSYTIAQQSFHNPELAPLFQLTSVFVPILAMSDVLAGAIRGFKRMDYPVIAQFVAQPIIRLVLILGLAIIGLDAWQAVITYGLADLAASILLLYFINRVFPLKRPVNAARRDVKAILGFSLPVWLSELMVKFQNNLQVLVLGSLNTITGVGVFSVASQITSVSGQFSSSLNVSAKPIIAELHHRKDMNQMERIYQTTNKWSLMVQLPVFLALVLFPAQILSIFGEDFSAGATALIILAWADLINICTGMGGIIIDMTGYTKLKLLNSIIRLAIYLGLSVILIPRWGIVGAAAVSMFGEGVVNLLRLFQVYFLFRILPYNKSFIKPAIAGLLSLACLLIIEYWFPVGDSTLILLLHVAALFTIYGAWNLIMGLSSDDRAMLTVVGVRARTMFSRS
jgi:O-antigen/teichoic acid export membrane protein